MCCKSERLGQNRRLGKAPDANNTTKERERERAQLTAPPAEPVVRRNREEIGRVHSGSRVCVLVGVGVVGVGVDVEQRHCHRY
jgi:hypothetical protein